MPHSGRHKADQTLLMALACGATVENAAKTASVSPATVYRRLQDPEFQRKLQEIRSDMVVRTSSMLTAAGMESVKTLLSLQQPTIPHTVRLGAARAVLEIGLRAREAASLEERLAVIEQQLATASSVL